MYTSYITDALLNRCTYYQVAVKIIMSMKLVAVLNFPFATGAYHGARQFTDLRFPYFPLASFHFRPPNRSILHLQGPDTSD
jgi:hypothetical protein